MARYKPNLGQIDSLEDADGALREIGLAENELKTIDAAAHKKIAEIKDAAEKEGEPLRKAIAELSAKIQAYAEYNRDELFKDGKKSLVLSFGIFGWRKSTKISVKKTTLALLKKAGWLEFVRIKEEPDKEAMGSLDDKSLAKVDAARKVTVDFFCEPNIEEVNKDLLKAAS
jgi:phage host-nuclease inhibitor protein Gam